MRSLDVRAQVLGVIAVVAFSITLPATRAAAPELGGLFVGLGRAATAGVLAAALLIAMRMKPPPRHTWRGIALVALGTVVGFPVLASIALESAPSAHGAVVIGLLPAATAVAGVLRAHERPPLLFWIGCVGGVIAVIAFAIAQGAGRITAPDALLLAAVVLAAIGYAEGGIVARELSGFEIMSWALAGSLPFTVIPTLIEIVHRHPSPSPAALAGFAYVAFISQFVGLVVWYRALADGGVARIGQLQLVQPVLTLVWSAMLLHEPVNVATIVAAIFVVASAALTQYVRRPATAAPEG